MSAHGQIASVTRRAIARLRDQRGIGLVEMLVAAASFTFVVGAANPATGGGGRGGGCRQRFRRGPSRPMFVAGRLQRARA